MKNDIEMAREYIKAVIRTTVMGENKPDDSEFSDELLVEPGTTPSASTDSMGLRSPGGPMRGRSVKEYEEQLAGLKKENFNLKLRIYFLEERMGSSFDLEKEDIVNKNVDLMVEVESLKKELQEKHDLLRQSVKAMELGDEENKKLITERDDKIAVFQEQIENLKVQLLDIKTENEILSARSSRSEAAELFGSQVSNHPDASLAYKELEEKIRTLEEELCQEKENSVAIQIILDQKEAKIKNLTSQLDEATTKAASHEEELKHTLSCLNETKSRCQGLHKKLQEQNQIVDELAGENQELRKRVTDMEKDRKRLDKAKQATEQKVAELQSKLEASLAELKKSQDLVVSNSTAITRPRYTDDGSFSVQKPAASSGSPQKNAFVFPTDPSPVVTPVASPSPSVNFSLESNIDLKQVIEQLKTERDTQHQKVVKLKAEQMKACKIIKEMIASRSKVNDEMLALKKRKDELEKELEGVVTKVERNKDQTQTNNVSNENSMDEQSGELVDHYKALTDELEEKNRILMATMNEKDKQVKRIHEQYEEMLRSIKEKEGQIVDLEFQLLSMADGKKPEHDSDPNEYYQKRLKEKDDEIEQLNNQLFKRTCDLQGLVNNELWQKNREIERLQQRQASRIIESKDLEIEKLNVDLMVKEKQLGLIVEKISELGLDIEIGDGEINIEGNLQAQLEKSEKLRAETNDVCTVLSRRLEELAFFLDSLLKQKSVLGFLGNKENRRLRQIIDQSLDLSRSFTMSMLINPDQSLLQLTSISSVLDNSKITEEEEEEASASRFSIMPDNISLTYKSHLHRRDNGDHSQIIQTLRQQIVNLKYELQLRDVELGKVGGNGMIATEVSSDKGENETQNVNLHTTSTTLKYKSDNQSESEAWSEPDRTVSRARIGLQDGSIRSNSSRKSVSHLSTDSTEDEDIERSPRSTGKKGVDSRNTILELHRQVCDLTQKMNEKEVLHKEANNKLKQELANLQLKLEEAEQRSEQLQQEKENLLMKFEIQDKELNNKINSIEVEKTESLKLAEDTKQEMQIIERKLISLQNEMALSEQTLRNQYEEQLHDVEEDCLKKIKSLQNNAEMEIKLLHDTIQQLHLEYTTNYVKKRQVEEAVEEIERLKSDLESLEDRMKEMNSEGVQSKKKLNEYEDKINSLRSDLDNTTLQYSEAVLEKTKIANEKALIEQELNRTTLREIDMKKKLQEMEVGLEQLLHTHQKKMSLLQEEKSLLEVRVSELESSNAQLHNKLIKYQTSCGDQMSSTSLPNTPNFVNQIVSFRRQHSDNSNYLPDDQFVFEGIQPGRGFHRLMPNLNLDLERNEANSSPDLGIESDHGRFSSLETHLNVQRPLLQTLELTESMSNLLDTEGPCIQELAREDSHCCQKSMEMANENTDLKRKLLRTRRALEETVSQLTLANQRKKQVEKTICKQIHKTSQVLRKAKANLDSGSETDGYRK